MKKKLKPKQLRFDVDLQEIREAIAEEQRPDNERYEAESPEILARLASQGVSIDHIGGNCPVQAEGKIGAKTKFYFRARGDRWQLHITASHLPFFEDEWQIDRDYGEWPDAGWMPRIEALWFIEQGINEWRSMRPQRKGTEK